MAQHNVSFFAGSNNENHVSNSVFTHVGGNYTLYETHYHDRREEGQSGHLFANYLYQSIRLLQTYRR